MDSSPQLKEEIVQVEIKEEMADKECLHRDQLPTDNLEECDLMEHADIKKETQKNNLIHPFKNEGAGKEDEELEERTVSPLYFVEDDSSSLIKEEHSIFHLTRDERQQDLKVEAGVLRADGYSNKMDSIAAIPVNNTCNKTLKCPDCEFLSPSKYYLQRHMTKIHNISVQEYFCGDCEFKTIYKQNLLKHIDGLHLKFKKFSCGICSYKTVWKNRLEIHHHDKHLKIKKFTCNHCAYATNVKQNLSFHVRGVHLQIKEHKCPQCTYKASFKSQLTRHIKNNHETNQKQIKKCNQCNRFQTSDLSMLHEHKETTHQISLKFSCDLCDYRSDLKGSVQVHKKGMHLKKKEFKCELCDYECIQRSKLRVHIDSVHEKVKKFHCSRCDYQASQKSNLNAHIQRIHIGPLLKK